MLGLISWNGRATTAGMMDWNKDIELMARTWMSSRNRGSERNGCARVVVPILEESRNIDGTFSSTI